MRVIFETPPIAGVSQQIPNGLRIQGFAKFFATAYDPGEAVPPNTNPPTMGAWRRDPYTQPDGSMRVTPPADIVPPTGTVMPHVVIPAAVLRDLPDDARLTLTWRVTRGAQK